jgi:hypothetical protein
MTTITINPLQGLDIAGVGRVDLGQSRSDLETILGEPVSGRSDDKRSFFEEYECIIYFDDADKVEFVEFITGPFPERVQLSPFGVDPFQIGADHLVALLSEKNDGLIDGKDGGYSYSFLNISVGIWRDAKEEDLKEWVEEKKISGEYEIDRKMIEEELAKSRNFWTVGIGVSGYYTEHEQF